MILSCARPYASSPVTGLWEVTEDVPDPYRATFRADGTFLLVFAGTTTPVAGIWTADDVFVELETWANPKLKFAYLLTENDTLMTFYPALGGKPIRFRSIAAP